LSARFFQLLPLAFALIFILAHPLGARGVQGQFDPSLVTGAQFASEVTTHTFYVDQSGSAGASGSQSDPVPSLRTALFDLALPKLKLGESVRIAIEPGQYREGDLLLNAFIEDNKNLGGNVQDTLLIIEGLGITPEETLFLGTQAQDTGWSALGGDTYSNVWTADLGESYVGSYSESDVVTDPKAPRGLTAESADRQIPLRWARPVNAPSGSVTYTIQRMSANNIYPIAEGDWSDLTSVSSADEIISYTDTNVKNIGDEGKLHFYGYRIRVTQNGVDHFSNNQYAMARGPAVDFIPLLSRKFDLLFINGERYEQVLTEGDLRPGTFFVDPGLKGFPSDGVVKVISSEDLSSGNAVVEVSKHQQFLSFTLKNNLILRNFSVWGYSNSSASTFQEPNGPQELRGGFRGVLDVKGYRNNSQREIASNILIEDISLTHNNGAGLTETRARDITVRNLNSSYNGYHGIHGMGSNSIVEDLTTNYNCWRRYMTGFDGWAVGAVKVTKAHNIIWRRHTSIGNYEHGLWFDISLENVLIEDCVIMGNYANGLFLEISQGPFKVTGCTIAKNRRHGILGGANQNASIENNLIFDNLDQQISITDNFRQVDGGEIRTAFWTIANNDIFTHTGAIYGQANSANAPYSPNVRYAEWMDTLFADSNRYYHDQSQNRFGVKNGVANADFASWKSQTTQDTNSSWGNIRLNPAPDLVGEWLFEDVLNESILDSSTYGNRGQWKNNPAQIFARDGRAYQLNGSNHLSIGDGRIDSSLNLQEFTMSIWVKADKSFADMAANTNFFFEKAAGSNNEGYMFGAFGSNVGVRLYTGNSTSESIQVSYPDDTFGQWTHYAATYNGSEIVIYRDGVAMVSQSISVPINDSSDGLDLGLKLEGAIDNARLYKRALSAAEIQLLTQDIEPDGAASGSGFTVVDFDASSDLTQFSSPDADSFVHSTNGGLDDSGSARWNGSNSDTRTLPVAFSGSDDHVVVSGYFKWATPSVNNGTPFFVGLISDPDQPVNFGNPDDAMDYGFKVGVTKRSSDPTNEPFIKVYNTTPTNETGRNGSSVSVPLVPGNWYYLEMQVINLGGDQYQVEGYLLDSDVAGTLGNVLASRVATFTNPQIAGDGTLYPMFGGRSDARASGLDRVDRFTVAVLGEDGLIDFENSSDLADEFTLLGGSSFNASQTAGIGGSGGVAVSNASFDATANRKDSDGDGASSRMVSVAFQWKSSTQNSGQSLFVGINSDTGEPFRIGGQPTGDPLDYSVYCGLVKNGDANRPFVKLWRRDPNNTPNGNNGSHVQADLVDGSWYILELVVNYNTSTTTADCEAHIYEADSSGRPIGNPLASRITGGIDASFLANDPDVFGFIAVRSGAKDSGIQALDNFESVQIQ